jgi:uncharacterized membrane protein YphA (DoxX/SURF4 family)
VGHVTSFLERGGTQVQFVDTMLLGHYVALAHLCGGLMVAAGLLTRLAAVVQVPILIGAVFLVHLREGFFGTEQNLELAVLVLFLLVLTVVHGGGQLSVDRYLARKYQIQTLEPTQVAGFNQFYDDGNLTKSRRYGAALDHKFTRNIFGGTKVERRDMEVTFLDSFADPSTQRAVGGKGRRAYLFWTPTARSR